MADGEPPAGAGREPDDAFDVVDEADDEDEVDLSFAGPEPVASAPWPLRLLDVASAYLPLVMMAALAGGTWWLVRNAPGSDVRRAEEPPRHEADYVMTKFLVRRFRADGSLRTQIEGERLRHFPDDDTLEVDDARIRSIGDDGTVTLASARLALANGDGSELQLFGDAHITRLARGPAEPIDFRSEFLHAFRNVERVRSHRPVVVTRGATVVRAEGFEYDNLSRVVDLKGRSSASFPAPARQARSQRSAAP